jgi:glycosyltransferase involved in cell wall biosynthesis
VQISIVIPVYNSQDTIVRALESVRKQTYPLNAVEIILVNDGSTDKSLEIMENYVRNSDIQHIKIINKENGGVAKARNTGIKASVGDYIALLDADDEWTENKLFLQMKCFKDNPSIDLLGGLRKGEVLNRFFFKKFSYVTKISAKSILYKVFFCTPTLIFKRKIIDEIGYFDEEMRHGEDGHFLLRVCNEKDCFLLNEGVVVTKGGLPDFGHSGLSANLKGMQDAIDFNLKMALNMHIVNKLEYFFIKIFGNLKYLRRRVITQLNRINK